MKLEVAAPAGMRELVAELAVDHALRVSTQGVGADGVRLEATTLIHLDGDVTTSISRACVGHDGADELLGRHLEELGRLVELFRRGAGQMVRAVAWLSAGLAVAGVAIDAATGHAWWHALATLLAITGAGAGATALARRFGLWLVVRVARPAIARRRATPVAPGTGPVA
jgi:hypothetical protein